ncbi:phage tail protein I [Arhodomonas aquaeolei]|uniref:phage tail protein I n=1 Tax=Arhodomonas aquaeolei TaxID=2369 RepID=UPI0021676B9A|nr:phage tail protein I [Arhodomonas aquaeolei]MCS4503910.1 phage tail protein I [Arhodomonas aquaeolei]
MSKSLLPPNRSRLERDLEAVTERSTAVEAPYNELWDPWACPIAALPWLAWALGVQEWSSSWPEGRKRSVVAAAMGVRRRAGTAAAVREAVESLDIEGIEYSEWHEYGGDPGTYRLTATLEERGMDQAQYDELVRVIERAGRLSAHLDPVGFTVIGRGAPTHPMVTLGGLVMDLRPYRITEREQAHTQYGGAGQRGLATTALRPYLETLVVQSHRERHGLTTRAAAWTTVYPD